MGEFHDSYTASRLFGAPPGYVGYEEGGQLTEKVRRKPFSVVLFDEIEKAHQEVYNTLLQVLEDGRLTDGQGRTVDFKNTVIIFTSNLGTRDISKAVGLGFASGNDEGSNYERMKNKVNDELKKHFRPEFLNRIDDIVVFHQLTEEQIITMVDLMITRVEAQLANKDMAIELTPAAKALLARRGFDPVLGARPLRRTIQREIEDQLSEKIDQAVGEQGVQAAGPLDGVVPGGVQRGRVGPGSCAPGGRRGGCRAPGGRCRRTSAPGGRGPSCGREPASRQAQRSRTGQAPHRGVPATQTRAPSSIAATEKRTARPASAA